MKKHRFGMWLFVAVLLALGVVAVIAMTRTKPAVDAEAIPMAQVKRGDLNLQVHATGELSASHILVVVAPAIGGDSLQITTLARTGEPVKKGDVIVEFDPSEQHYKLEQNHSELLQAEQEITKAKADDAVLAAEDKVSLLKARYGVRRAELDVEKNELVSKIDGEKNDLALQRAKRVLGELEHDIQSHRASGQASIFLAQEKYNKAKLAMDQAQQNLDRMRVTASMDGLVSIQKNMNASGGFFFTGMSLPDYRPGDQVQPGSPIAQILDPTGMNLTSKVPEDQHDNIKPGESADVTFDALPGTIFHGTVKTVGAMAMQSIFSSDSSHGFDVTVELATTDPRLRPGLTAQIIFRGNLNSNVLYIPRQALFMHDGKRIVYVKSGGSYQQREVKVTMESESRAAIDGLSEGTEVSLLDPTIPRKQSGGAPGGTAEGAP
jgi:multidrug efflux pump subunit AcrA (membrane-fusion protein)